jgi:serine/threonine protein kinase
VLKKWRAVKIMGAKASKLDCADFKTLELFEGISPDVLAANHVQLPIDHFWLEGPNGRHLCFVLPFFGPKLSDVYPVYGHVSGLLKDICFQLVDALRFIHSHGLCHGDFRTQNILFRLSEGVDEWEDDKIMAALGKPDLVPVEWAWIDETEIEHYPGVPDYLVERTSIAYGSGVCSSEIAVIDFGVSYRVSHPPLGKGTGIPLSFAAPENTFWLDEKLGFHSDIWALGVAVAQVRCGFVPFADEEYDNLLEGIRKMECIVGPLPEPYRSIWRKWNGPFINCQDEHGETRDDDSWKDESVLATVDTLEQESTLRSRVRWGRAPNYLHYRLQAGLIQNLNAEEAADIAAQAASNPALLPLYKWGEDCIQLTFHDQVKYTMTGPEVDQLFDLLLSIFQWHPEKRATIDQVANHAWFGDRNRRHLAAPPSPPSPTKNANKRQTPSPTSQQMGKKPRHMSGEVDGQGEEVAAYSSTTMADVWRSLVLCRGRILRGLWKGPRWATRILVWFTGRVGKAFVGVIRTSMRSRGWTRASRGGDSVA